MIRCSHCGKLAPTGALSCQHCGMPLVSGGNGGAGAGQAEQEDLPAWLESLRAHERPVSNNQENRQPFSLDELVGEDSMPSWMRQDRRKMPESGNSDSLPALPAMPANAGPEKQQAPTAGFQAGSLIDERSLPSWMRENQGQAGAQPGMTPNVSAHSLVDQQGLPNWIKDLSQSMPAASKQSGDLSPRAPLTPPATPPSSSRMPQTPPTGEPSAAFSQGFSAHDLVDAQAMPGWMSGSQGPGQGPGAPPTRPVPIGQGFSAGELIDQRSVPQWMKELQGREKSDPQSAMGVPVSGSGQTTGTSQGKQGTSRNEGRPAQSFQENNSMPTWLQESQLNSTQTPGGEQSLSAGSLMDSSSAPAWMREGLQGASFDAPTGGQGMSAGSLLDMNSMPAWMREGEQGSAQGGPNTGQGMAAGSLIDMNAMPAWLRNSDPGPAGASGARPGQAPARPVPSRPRHEGMPQEQSEAAANVFASMLGVAASTPALPGQEYTQGAMGANLGVAQGQPTPPLPPFPQAQQSLPGWQQPEANQYNQGAQARMWQMSGPMPAANAQPGQNPYAPTGQPAREREAPPRLNNADQPAWAGGYSAADRTALGVTSSADIGTQRPGPYPGNAQNTDTKKKGFFDSIRDFFYK